VFASKKKHIEFIEFKLWSSRRLNDAIVESADRVWLPVTFRICTWKKGPCVPFLLRIEFGRQFFPIIFPFYQFP
jgi:hypothetical protein